MEVGVRRRVGHDAGDLIGGRVDVERLAEGMLVRKYFSAIVAVSTAVFGRVSAVAGLPRINGIEKMLNRSGSTCLTLSS